MKNKKKHGNRLPGIILIISALFLSSLIIILVSQNKVRITITDENSNRELAGSYPLPSELIESDKKVYFTYMEIPDMIFNKMNGKSYRDGCPVTREDLSYVQLLYWGKDNEAHKGEMIVNKAIAEDITDIFFELYKAYYPIEKISLIDEYGGNDEVSMADDNTCCFNTRKITGGNGWSLHAYGLAIDINPFFNPYVGKDGSVLPVMSTQYADRSVGFDMKIDESDLAYKLFTEHGFTWGGSWNDIKDYQHFEKTNNK